ncbi:MAG: hypothetical protein AAFV53_11530 [Myxococcota bacterium]
MNADWTQAFRPRPQLDGLLALPHLLRLQSRDDLDELQRVLVVLRLAEVNRRFLPEAALTALDKADETVRSADLTDWPQLHPATIRAAAWLEGSALAEAEAQLADVPENSGVRALLLARCAHLGGQLQAALDGYWNAAQMANASHQPLSAETELEARSYHLRLRLAQRELPEDEIAAFDQTAQAMGAGMTQSLHRAVVQAHRDGHVEALSDGFIKVAHTMTRARYLEGHAHLIAELAPLPVQVHGAMVTHRDDPAAYVTAILSLSSLAWRAGYTLEGYEVAAYGVRVGARRFGDHRVVGLSVYLDGLRERAGAQTWQQLQQKAAQRARAAQARRNA